MSDRKLTAVGAVSGIGSMLVGAKQAGFDILANVEHRRYYHAKDELGRNTFTENFPGAIFKEKITDLTPQEIERIMNPDLILSHCDCGNFSQLAGANKNRLAKLNDPADIPVLINMLDVLKPRFFAADNLPKSLGAVPITRYADQLPEYDLFVEHVSNWGYGNPQKFRNRFFIIGALKSENFVFIPNEEVPQGLTLESVIGDLPDPDNPPPGVNMPPNHYPTALDEISGRSKDLRFRGDRPTWREVRDWLRENNWPTGKSVSYHAADLTTKFKPGEKIEHDDERGVSVQCGASYKFKNSRLTPLTVRERARIQGFPDDFVFYGARLNAKGEYNYDRNVHLTKSTGKAMPIQFNYYLSRQIAAHILGQPFEASGHRITRPSPDINRAKMQYCESVGYSNQSGACSACWLYNSCTIRMRKYGIGAPAKGQHDVFDPGLVPGPEEVTARPKKEVAQAPTRAAGARRVIGDRAVRPTRFAEVSREEEHDLFGGET